jgi:hypothetical protein
MAKFIKEERKSWRKTPLFLQRWKYFHGKKRGFFKKKEGAEQGRGGLKWKHFQGKGGKIFM